MTISVVSEIMDWLIEKGFLISPDLIETIQTEEQVKSLKELVLNGTINPNSINFLSKKILKGNLNGNINGNKIQNVHEIELITGFKNEVRSESKNKVETQMKGEIKSELKNEIGKEMKDKVKSESKNEINMNLEENAPIIQKDEFEQSNNERHHIAVSHGEYNPQFKVQVVTNYQEESIDRKVQDFVKLFNARFKAIEKIIASREQIKSRVSIGRLKNKTDRETVSIIGLVNEISFTKNGHIIVTLEDDSGSFKVLFSKSNPELLDLASNLTLDEIIGVIGTSSKTMLFAKEIIWPEVPIMELKKSPLDEYAIFLSDFHFGSKYFMKDEFDKFIKWIRGEVGNANQKDLAKKVKYIFVIGDLVDGIGIYPNQYNELEIKDIYEQYKLCSEKLNLIPKNKAIIICPGNHDALRLSEPQPALSKKLVPMLYEMPNTFMVSNPAFVNIGKVDGFSGFNVLMYHGYSFDYYIANIDKIRNNGGYDKPELIMKFLLRRRHLAPTYGSTLYVPEATFDPLVINNVPDIFATGHIHKSAIKNYRNITMISGSCWQAKTAFQEKVGHHPEPCRVPIVHLNTRKIKILKFTK